MRLLHRNPEVPKSITAPDHAPAHDPGRARRQAEDRGREGDWPLTLDNSSQADAGLLGERPTHSSEQSILLTASYISPLILESGDYLPCRNSPGCVGPSRITGLLGRPVVAYCRGCE